MTSKAHSSIGQPGDPLPSLASSSTHTIPAPRILLITYHFPPDRAVGGLRWARMATHLHSYGFELDVLTREMPAEEDLDVESLESLPAGIRVFTVHADEPMRTRMQRAVWPRIRAMFPNKRGRGIDAISQADIGNTGRGTRRFVRSYFARLAYARDGKWARAAALAASQKLIPGDYVAVITSGPPHMVHEAGRRLSARFHVPHIVDMRDPWSLNERIQEYLASPVWLQLAKQYEQAIVRDAALVTMNTDKSCRAMRQLYPAHEHKIHVIRNGSDDEPLPVVVRDARFSIRFAGTIYMDRDPRPFLRAARRVIKELDLSPAEFEIAFAGTVDRYAGGSTATIIQEEGLSEYVRLHKHLSRKDAMVFLAGATMLLSLPQDCNLAIPAKIYEYLRFDAWLLILAAEDSATAELLRDTDASVLDPADETAMTSIIRQRYLQFRSGITPSAIGGTGQFNRSVQTARLLELMREFIRWNTAEPSPASRAHQVAFDNPPLQ